MRYERPFRPWSYQVTQRRLELRTDGNFEFGETIYVAFLDVAAMQIRRTYDWLEVSESDNVAEIGHFADIPERHKSRFLTLSVGDGAHTGFVVCAAFEVRMERPIA
ncbi:hypothetical protein [Polymorphospora rubra]|uniref:hypothetical protein n=1 Tax=Polymorphospora rubra TaxID=338584 RepID=UPI0033E544AD